MKVYLVRHGQTIHNKMMMYNTTDEDLTENGINQAYQLKEKLKDIEFDKIIVSPLIRTRHTVSIIKPDADYITDSRIMERDCGSLAGTLTDNSNRVEYWNYNTKEYQGTEEDIKLFFKRVFSFLDELSHKDYDKVLIVAHSGVSKAFSAYFDGIGDGYFLNRGLGNCEIKEYELKER